MPDRLRKALPSYGLRRDLRPPYYTKEKRLETKTPLDKSKMPNGKFA
jgi:hypothetical protein